MFWCKVWESVLYFWSCVFRGYGPATADGDAVVSDKCSLILFTKRTLLLGGGKKTRKTSFGKFVDAAVVTTDWNKTVFFICVVLLQHLLLVACHSCLSLHLVL